MNLENTDRSPPSVDLRENAPEYFLFRCRCLAEYPSARFHFVRDHGQPQPNQKISHGTPASAIELRVHIRMALLPSCIGRGLVLGLGGTPRVTPLASPGDGI